MDDFPSNSHRQKEAAVKPDPAVDKKIEKVVTGEVVRKKKSPSKRFKETFFSGENLKSAFSHVTSDILVPYAKDAVADSVSQGIEKMLFQEVRSSSRRGGSRLQSGLGHVAYNAMSNRGPSSGGFPGRSEPRSPSRRARATHDFDDIVLSTRAEAEEVIDRLFDLVSRYEVATVADLYELVGVTGSFTDNKWGWIDIRGAEVNRTRDGFLVNLPRPEPID